jgi:septal ring factor EnvC (AmiA/AmiB activator)
MCVIHPVEFHCPVCHQRLHDNSVKRKISCANDCPSSFIRLKPLQETRICRRCETTRQAIAPERHSAGLLTPPSSPHLKSNLVTAAAQESAAMNTPAQSTTESAEGAVAAAEARVALLEQQAAKLVQQKAKLDRSIKDGKITLTGLKKARKHNRLQLKERHADLAQLSAAHKVLTKQIAGLEKKLSELDREEARASRRRAVRRWSERREEPWAWL